MPTTDKSQEGLTHAGPMAPRSLTLRAVLLGVLAVPMNVYLVIQTETVWTTQYPTTMTIIFNAVATLLFFSLLNLFLQRYVPAWQFQQGELLTIYLVVTLACVVCGHDLLQATLCVLGHSAWFATPENEWQTLFFRFIPDWLAVMDLEALTGYYDGTSDLLIDKHIRAWLKPVLCWLFFFSILAFGMMMFSVIIRRQWIEHEKLSYPVTMLPLAMTRSGFYRPRLLWFGFSLGLGVDLLNGLNHLFPYVPALPIRHNIGSFFSEEPWNAMGVTLIHLNPYAIGLGFLMPLDLSFSCWIFYLFWKLQRIGGAMVGINHIPGYPHVDMQSSGAYITLAIFGLWVTRKHLWQVVRAIFFRPWTGYDDSREPISYRAACTGLVVSILVIVAFWMQAGMSPWAIVLFFAIHGAYVLAFTRMRAELGTPTQDFYRAGPGFLLTAAFGSRAIGPQNLTGYAYFYGFTRNYRSQPMPNQLEGFKMAEQAGMNSGQLLWLMWLATVFGLLIGFITFLHAGYKYGSLGTWRGQEAFSDLQRWLLFPSQTDWTKVGFFSVGAILTSIMLICRLRLIWWPFHPLAYPLAANGNFQRLWFPVFLAWLIKFLILRHGGVRTYRRVLPIFLGAMLGEFLMGTIWALLGLALGHQMYSFKHW